MTDTTTEIKAAPWAAYFDLSRFDMELGLGTDDQSYDEFMKWVGDNLDPGTYVFMGFFGETTMGVLNWNDAVLIAMTFDFTPHGEDPTQRLRQRLAQTLAQT